MCVRPLCFLFLHLIKEISPKTFLEESTETQLRLAARARRGRVQNITILSSQPCYIYDTVFLILHATWFVCASLTENVIQFSMIFSQ